MQNMTAALLVSKTPSRSKQIGPSRVRVCRARLLTDEMRSAIARYFSVYKGIENGRPRIDIPANGFSHPCIERAVEMIKERWMEVCFSWKSA